MILECRSVLPRGRGMLRQFGTGHSWFLNPGMSLCPRTGLAASMHLLVNNSTTPNTQQAAASFVPSNLWDDVDVRFYLLLLFMHLQNSCCELPAREATAGAGTCSSITNSRAVPEWHWEALEPSCCLCALSITCCKVINSHLRAFWGRTHLPWPCPQPSAALGGIPWW